MRQDAKPLVEVVDVRPRVAHQVHTRAMQAEARTPSAIVGLRAWASFHQDDALEERSVEGVCQPSHGRAFRLRCDDLPQAIDVVVSNRGEASDSMTRADARFKLLCASAPSTLPDQSVFISGKISSPT